MCGVAVWLWWREVVCRQLGIWDGRTRYSLQTTVEDDCQRFNYHMHTIASAGSTVSIESQVEVGNKLFERNQFPRRRRCVFRCGLKLPMAASMAQNASADRGHKEGDRSTLPSETNHSRCNSIQSVLTLTVCTVLTALRVADSRTTCVADRPVPVNTHAHAVLQMTSCPPSPQYSTGRVAFIVSPMCEGAMRGMSENCRWEGGSLGTGWRREYE